VPLINWTKTFSVGVEVLDDDHKQLFGLVNELYDGLEAGQAKEPIGQALDRLVEYTNTHFSREEQLFASTSYAGASAHKGEHDALIKQMTALRQEFKEGTSPTLPNDVMRFLKTWLVHHILGSDRKYGPHLNDHGVQ